MAAGSIIAGFRVVSLLSDGPMAAVFVAEDIGTGRRVALKFLAPELARDERFRRRFLRESELASTLRHPNIVETVRSGEVADDGLYLATAYVDGSDLRTLLRREGLLGPERAVLLVEQVAAALDTAHAAGLIHRDVKPANVLVADDGESEHAFVCDFGLARHVSSVSSLTGDRGFVGTIDYVPPEQIEGRPVDPRADVYSLGCLLFESLTGSKPFDRDSELSVVFAHLNEPPPAATELRPGLPAAFDEVFRTALAKAPDDRFASCSELAKAARAALYGEFPPHRRRTRRRVVLIAVCLAALTAAAVAAIGATTGASGPPAITPSAIDGLLLGRTQSWYARHIAPPGYKASVVDAPFSNKPLFPELAFQTPAIGVYFPKNSGKAFIITTWNRDYRTAAGIGPCSTIAQMLQAYGRRAVPTYSGTDPHNPKRHGSWQLGRSLLFMTDNQKTISSVVLFHGPANPRAPVQTPGTNQGWANYLGANETACK